MQAISEYGGFRYFEPSSGPGQTKGYTVEIKWGNEHLRFLVCTETREQARSMYGSAEIAAHNWNYDLEDMRAYLIDSAERAKIEMYQIG